MSDLHQEITNVSVGSAAPSPAGSGAAGGEGFGAERVRAEWAEVEVTLTDLDPELEQLFDGFLEPLDPSGAEIVRVIDFIVMLPAHEEQIPESVPLTDCERCVGSGPIVFERPDVCDRPRPDIFLCCP
jgi:hypothetical protein